MTDLDNDVTGVSPLLRLHILEWNVDSDLETNHTVAEWDEALCKNSWPAQRL